MKSLIRRSSLMLALTLVLTPYALGQLKLPKPGFNLFSKDQDVQIGKEGSAQVEQELALVTDREISTYIETIGKRLAATPEADNYPYTFKVVWDENINAFALPGGPTYIHTGLILAAENEAQLAGVMGHEISHVALRHGTNQASKANLLQLGALLGSAVLGREGGITGTLAQIGIGFGANSVLLKYSRNAEKQADLLGARMMARAGYNPVEAARFFEILESQVGKRSGLEQFFASHPNPGNRVKNLEEVIQYFPPEPYNASQGQLKRIQDKIKRMTPPPAPKKSAQGAGQGTTSPNPRPFQGRGYGLTVPGGWQVFGDADETSATFAPEDGIVRAQSGAAIARGVVTNIQPAQQGQRVNLARDTAALIEELKRSNPSMQASGERTQRLRVDGNQALLTTLYSDSPFQGQTEIDLLLTVQRPQGLFYMVFIAPQQEFRQFEPTFEQMRNSVKVTF